MTRKNAVPDVIVVGAGPAGLSAAMWCAELGMSAAVFEKEVEAGGQLLRIYNPVTNYIGITAAGGRELRDIFVGTYSAKGPQPEFSAEISEIDTEARSVTAGNGRQMSARALVIATGVRRRRLSVPGEELLTGKGVFVSGSRDRESARGKTVVIVGGGDAALENALILAEFAKKVYVVHRRAEITARAEFADRARRENKIELRPETAVDAILGGSRVEGVRLTHLRTGAAEELAADIVLARIGVEPNSDLVRGKVDLDPHGYILVNGICQTSAPGVYAVGDVSNPVSPTIATAAGSGATAAKAIFRSLHDAKDV